MKERLYGGLRTLLANRSETDTVHEKKTFNWLEVKLIEYCESPALLEAKALLKMSFNKLSRLVVKIIAP